jgi:hypothetical protein
MKQAPDRANDQGAYGQQDYLQNPQPFSTTSNRLSIVPRAEAGRLEYIAGLLGDQVLRGQNPRYALALRVELVDLRKQYCTCCTKSPCPVCLSYMAASDARNARKGAT